MRNASAALTTTAMEGLGRVAMVVLALASARILEPAQIGVLGLAVIVIGLISIVGAYSEVGAAIATGVETDSQRGWAGTLWRFLTTATASIVVAAAVGPIAGLLGGTAEQASALEVLILFLLWLPWIETLSAYPRIVLRRRCDFSYLARLGFLGTVVFVFSSVALLIWERRPEAVISGQLMSATVVSGITWLRLLRTQPGSIRSPPTRAEVSRVGAESFRLFLGSSGGYLSERFDNLLVAANLGSALLPFYSVAWNLCRTPVALVSQAAANITTAVAVERGDPTRLAQTLRNTHRFSHLMMSLCAGVLFFVAPLFVEPVLGRKWLELAPMLPILAIGLLFAPVQIVAGTFLVSQEKAHLIGMASAAHILAQLALIPPLCARFGVTGAGYADVVNNLLVTTLVCIAMIRTGGDLRWFELRSSLALTGAAGLSGGMAALLAVSLFSSPWAVAVLALALALLLFPVIAATMGGYPILKESAQIVGRWTGFGSRVALLP